MEAAGSAERGPRKMRPEKRQEGNPKARSRGTWQWGKTPEGRNPKGATSLKMAGGFGEEKAVERVRNPVGGTYPVWRAGGEWTRRS